MKHGSIALALLFFLFLAGCVNINLSKGGSGQSIACGNNLCESGELISCGQDCGSVSPGLNAPPFISSSSLNPSNPDMGEVFTLSITAQDDGGVRYIFWNSSKPVLVQGNPVPLKGDFYDCAFQPSCTASFSLSSEEQGEIQILAYADDSVGFESARSDLSVIVQPFRRNTPADVCGNRICESSESWETCESDCPLIDCSGEGCSVPEPETNVCGNGVCGSGEAFEICPQDCPRVEPQCSNSVCEGGESYENCPQDCTLQNILGTSCGDDACQPGEDADYCPADCESIRPNCGNGVCDSWESKESCYEDCPFDNGGGEAGACSTNSDCGYKQICSSGSCQSVQCTNDAQCTGCRRCSDYSCRSCGHSPYGVCYC